jgi:uncharacterized repeat protein (TIGR03809 family)
VPVASASVFLLAGWFMTYRADVARGWGIIARWRVLAERRLEHLTELFETGRWRRYHSELAFLENIKEARTAVEIWRDLSTREASPDNMPVDISWLGRTETALRHGETVRDQVHRLLPPLVTTAAEPPSSDLSISRETGEVASGKAPFAPVMENAAELIPDVNPPAERYPVLRSVL